VLAAVVLAATLLGLPAPDVAATSGSFTRHTGGQRDYWLYLPPGATQDRPLVVYLHGCTQNALDASVGTRWNALAERERFAVLYPEQSAAANGALCWNWFLSEHQKRDSGEPAIIAGIVRKVAQAQGLDASRIYVLGASAGADMATNLAAAYPDLFAAVGGLAGCPYLTCSDLSGAAAHLQMGDRARVVPAFLVQGTADPLNNLAMGQALVAQWTGTDDLADDGSPNDSISREPSSISHYGLDPGAAGGVGTLGDPCVRNSQWPCPGALLGWRTYPHSVLRHANPKGCTVVENWVIHGLSHNYPGGDPKGTFTDPIGPDITAAAYEFFSRHSLAGPCT
jgi:poly(hydroxyalkanoate) depolymerase family esterase